MRDTDLTFHIAAADSLEAVHAACGRTAAALGFGHFLLGLRLPVPLDKPVQMIVSGYPRAWRQHYDACGYMRIDPALREALGRVLPVDWAMLDCATPPVAQMMDEARDAGLAHGLTVPVHGGGGEFGLLSLAGPDALPRSAEARMALMARAQWLGAQLHESLRALVRAPQPPLRGEISGPLTERERECLRLAAEGCSSAAIAERLGITERTVAFHFAQCQRKLGVRNRSHAVARALALREIQADHYPHKLAGSAQLVEPRVQ